MSVTSLTEEERREVYSPVVDYAGQRKRNREVDVESKQEQRYGQYLNIPTKKQVLSLSKKKRVETAQYHDDQGRVYIPISPVHNKEQIKSILWLDNRMESTDYDPSTDLFFFVLAAPRSEGARENLGVDNTLTLYGTIEHDIVYKGTIKDVYMVNKKNVVSIVMLTLPTIAQGRSLGTAL